VRIRIKVKRSQYLEALAKRRNWVAMSDPGCIFGSGAAVSLPLRHHQVPANPRLRSSLPVVRFDIAAAALAESRSLRACQWLEGRNPERKDARASGPGVSGMMPPAEALKQILAAAA
jgi:hypothetical protein